MGMLEELLNNRKVQILLIAILLIGLLPFAFKTIQFGMDFTGGTIIGIKLEQKATAAEVSETISILNERLNAYGLKDIKVRQAGDQLITAEIAETNPTIVNQLQAVIAEQGKFEALFDGQTILRGEDIVQVITNPQNGYGVYGQRGAFEWVAPFLITNDGAKNFADAIKGRCTPKENSETCEEKVIMFIDRPIDSIILLSRAQYESEKDVPIDFEISTELISLEDLMKYSGLQYEVIDSPENKDFSGKNLVVRAGTFKVSDFPTAAKVKEISQIGQYWIDDAARIENIVYLTPGVTSGKPITQPSITGHSGTETDAEKELKRIEVILRSGKLPVAVSIDTSSTISPELGENFLSNSILAGLLAIGTVSGIIFFRYRKPQICLPVIVIATSEVLMLIGMAAWIGWELDLAAVAAIISVAGTGVDHQIIITDELLMKMKTDDEDKNLISKIKTAFMIIVKSASTVIAAMLPLWFIGAGQLRGFALTTIIGCLIGVLIARPAFAEIIKRILEK